MKRDMPSLRDHCKHTKNNLEVTGKSIHRWMDEFIGAKHRRFRHEIDQEIPQFLIEEYGENLARNIILDHISLDKEDSINRIFNKPKPVICKRFGCITIKNMCFPVISIIPNNKKTKNPR